MKSIQSTILAGCALALTALIIWVVFTQPAFLWPQPPLQTDPATRYLPDYPINMQVTTYLGNPSLDETLVPLNMGDKLISVLTKVTYDEKSQQYLYNYKIGYLGKQPILLTWTVMDKVLSSNPLAGSILIPLEPDQTKEFNFTSTAPPTLSNGSAWLYRSRELDEDNKVWDLIPLDSQPGPLPKD
jgi:hypothetical protein